jgi:hypothetical protein
MVYYEHSLSVSGSAHGRGKLSLVVRRCIVIMPRGR